MQKLADERTSARKQKTQRHAHQPLFASLRGWGGGTPPRQNVGHLTDQNPVKYDERFDAAEYVPMFPRVVVTNLFPYNKPRMYLPPATITSSSGPPIALALLESDGTTVGRARRAMPDSAHHPLNMRALEMANQIYRSVGVHKRDEQLYVVDSRPEFAYNFQCDEGGRSCKPGGVVVPSDWDQLYATLYEKEYAPLSQVDPLHFFNCPDSLGKVEKTTISKYNNSQKWDDIKCKAMRVGPFLIKSTCRHPSKGNDLPDDNVRKWKVFVCGFTNLRDYGRALKDGLLTRNDHDLLGAVLQQQLQKAQDMSGKRLKIINHNEDVDILHFKFEERSNGAPPNVTGSEGDARLLEGARILAPP